MIPHARSFRAPAWLPRVLAIDLTVVIFAVFGTWEIVTVIAPKNPQLGGDLAFFRDTARRWLETGVLYLPHQLAGPYDVTLQVDNLYPPHALFLFVPFTVLPDLLWWLIPLGITAYVVAWLRPKAWSWPILAILILWPKTIIEVLWGNTDMWAMASVAAGVRWRWPAILVSMKPSFSVFALIGVRDRGFWVATLVLAVLAVPMAPLWRDWITAIRNMYLPPDYSLYSIPGLLIPIVAWLGRADRGMTARLDRLTARVRTTGEAGSTRAADGRP